MIPGLVCLSAWLALTAWMSRAPGLFARFARIAVETTTLPVPEGVASRLFVPRQETANYRGAPERGLALAALPDDMRTERGGQDIRFLPEDNRVLARRNGWATLLVRVDLSVGTGGLVLSARRSPDEIPWVALVAAGTLFRGHGLHIPFSTVVIDVAVLSYGFASSRKGAAAAASAVTEELRARLAIANGDPPPAPPSPPKLAGDEWRCACGTVNKMKRTMCSRCWAQRPGTPA